VLKFWIWMLCLTLLIEMRYLIDTNIFIFLVDNSDLLSKDVYSIMDDYSNTFYLSVESIKELIVLIRNKRVKFKQWKSNVQMIEAIENEFGIKILPIKREHLLTYARLEINKVQDHNDPSDHIIISQAITEKIPLISSDQKFQFYTKQKLDFINNSK
jgi:tRNA(fMet)-specific endonuclease VapC